MLLAATFLILSMALIVASSELFTNGIEWLGQRLNLNEGVVGSVLAAIGTALPETLVPLVAIVSFGSEQGNEVSVGAITGSPFMLSTLTLGLCGIFVYVFHKRGLRPLELKLDYRVLKRDLRFFLLAFSLAYLACFSPADPLLRRGLGAMIFLLYPVYIYFTLKADGSVGEEPGPLYLARFGGGSKSSNLALILLQTGLSVLGIGIGAYYFVDRIQDVSQMLGFPPQVLSIMISPIATEFPEKMNSILWLRRGKDTLALGNVTGALVFQGTILGGFGVACTQWNLGSDAKIGAAVAIVSGVLTLIMVSKEKLSFRYLSLGALVYLACILLFQFNKL